MSGVKESVRHVNRWTGIYSITALILFLIMALLGLLMRSGQAGVIDVRADYFYSIMTLHGLGMSGILYTAGYTAVWYLLARYVKPSPGVMRLNFLLILLGVIGLVVATLVGRFGAGWYLLYPLPFLKIWPHWSTGLATLSVMLLGVAWLLGQLDLLRAMAARYGPGGMLGWSYLTSGERSEELPPVVLITAVSMIAGALTTIVGAAMLMLYLAQWFAPELQFDALLMKNAVFLFGHTLVNITMYLGLAVLYELLPEFSGRPWKSNKVVVLSWNCVLVLVLFAFLHHLYMDFAQPVALQYLGQVASYLSAIPATVVTIFGAMTQVYRSGLRWSFVPLCLILGLTGWVIGGLAAVVDSTIAANILLHNTLWVPAHFHTYYLAGFVLMLFGFIYYFVGAQAEKTAKTALATMIFGSYGFLLAFYLSGFQSVPRRFASYVPIDIPAVTEFGQKSALVAAGFVLIFLAGLLLYLTTVFRSLPAWAARVRTGM